MDFGAVLVELKAGKKVARHGWPDCLNRWLCVQMPGGRERMTLPYAYLRTPEDRYVPWTATQEDMFAEDWAVCPIGLASERSCDVPAVECTKLFGAVPAAPSLAEVSLHPNEPPFVPAERLIVQELDIPESKYDVPVMSVPEALAIRADPNVDGRSKAARTARAVLKRSPELAEKFGAKVEQDA